MTKSNLICIKRLVVALVFAMLLCGFASNSFAEDVARAIVTHGNVYVKLYTIDEIQHSLNEAE